MKQLPIGVQSFRKIIEEDCAYADKTRAIYDLVQSGQYFFLSRPRRFGKSLLIDTLRELFLGHRELFKDLWIGSDEASYGFEPHPVIRLDMTQFSVSSPEDVLTGLAAVLKDNAAYYGLEPQGANPTEQFVWLIESLQKQTGQRVVVLIDEYDKPVIDHIDNPEMAQANRAVMGNFYGILKGQDANLHFVLLTGVSKYTKLSLFSKLNNLKDITLRQPFANICGITAEEFDELFGADVDAAERERIFQWYDGFSWDGETRLFNPFSLLNYMQDRQFNPYWFTTGTPTFLAKVFKDSPQSYAQIQDKTITELDLDSHDIENAPLVSLLFQTGFLTVGSANLNAAPPRYRLRYPNSEVASSLAQMFLSASPAVGDPYDNGFCQQMEEALDSGNPQDIAEPLTGLYASIPYELHIGAEAFYHALFLAVSQFMGFRVLGEVSVARGRIDGVIDRPCGKSYIIEFKYTAQEDDLGQALDQAAAQLEQRGYAERYLGSTREVYKLAIAVAARGQVAIRQLED
ncbi:MAG: ATP-binding protein [Coriobacteriales bacterium]|jgi:hypothetical protein|nr:ATP-binding protein [Coriobacteriales bacterium]